MKAVLWCSVARPVMIPGVLVVGFCVVRVVSFWVSSLVVVPRMMARCSNCVLVVVRE
jgi:hypothetical protein